MRMAAARSLAASAGLLGLAKLYVRASGMAGTATVRPSSARGVSRTVFQPASESTGCGSVSRYLPSHPSPCGERGSAEFQMSVPSKCDRLEFG